ncbi:hypothetical protein KI387_011807, partial [Taxus chinensis]
ISNGWINHSRCWARKLGWRKMTNITMDKEREERWLKYSEARERVIARQREVVSVMDLWRQTLWEGVEVHIKDVEPEQSLLAHIGKCIREIPSASNE